MAAPAGVVISLASAVALVVFAAYAWSRAPARVKAPLGVFAASWGAASAVPNVAQAAGLEVLAYDSLAAVLALPMVPALVALAWRPDGPKPWMVALVAVVAAVPLAPRAASWAGGDSFGLLWLAVVFTSFTVALALLAFQALARPEDRAPRALALALSPYPSFIAGFYLYGVTGAPTAVATGAYVALVLLAATWLAVGSKQGTYGPPGPRLVAWLLLALPLAGAIATGLAGGLVRGNEAFGLPGIARIVAVGALLWALKELRASDSEPPAPKRAAPLKAAVVERAR